MIHDLVQARIKSTLQGGMIGNAIVELRHGKNYTESSFYIERLKLLKLKLLKLKLLPHGTCFHSIGPSCYKALSV